jgi:hypothetical protein
MAFWRITWSRAAPHRAAQSLYKLLARADDVQRNRAATALSFRFGD